MTKPYTYVLEGIGEDYAINNGFFMCGATVRANDKECFEMTRRLVREEGILQGLQKGTGVPKYLKDDREDMVGLLSTG